MTTQPLSPLCPAYQRRERARRIAREAQLLFYFITLLPFIPLIGALLVK